MTTSLRRASVCSMSLLLLGLCAAGCGSDQETPVVSSPVATTTTTTQTIAETTTTPTTVVASTSVKAATTTRKANDNVEKARKMFGSLAPDSLFNQFDSCNPNGVEDSMACTGKEVGQFQFFASDAKAASTTQLLTGLRTSKVIKDTGRMVVGWSTLGNTAIITIVDNDKGLVLQQMVSIDEVDPTKQIYKLGLVEEEPTQEPTEMEPTETAAPNN